MNTEKKYTPENAAKVLNVTPSTLRKYALLFEQYGHKFSRNANYRRVYLLSDIQMLMEFLDLKGESDENIEDIVIKMKGGIPEKNNALQIVEETTGDTITYLKIEEKEIKFTNNAELMSFIGILHKYHVSFSIDFEKT